MREQTAHYREMQDKLTGLRTELAFAFSDTFHGGNHHTWEIAALREHIRDQVAEMEQIEKEGGRWVN